MELDEPPSGVYKDVAESPPSATQQGSIPKSNDSDLVRKIPVYTTTNKLSGTVKVNIPQGKKLDHLGLKVQLLGQTELFYDRGSTHTFLSLVKELDAPGTVYDSKGYQFSFDWEKPYETYRGLNVRVRYYVLVTLSRNYKGNLTAQKEVCVQHVSHDPEVNNSIKMEVGIEDCLHIEFEYEKQKYSLQDIIIGKIYFLLVRIKIKHMELAVIRRESAGGGQNVYNESTTLSKYEIMDGAPVRGECVPVRMFLKGVGGELTPTYRNVGGRFSLKYYLNLVLVDEEDRRYFKQQEITLWRKTLG